MLKNYFLRALYAFMLGLVTWMFTYGLIWDTRWNRPDGFNALTAFILSAVISLVVAAYGGYLKKPADAVLCWLTPLRSAMLYRRYVRRHWIMLMWFFLAVPAAIAGVVGLPNWRLNLAVWMILTLWLWAVLTAAFIVSSTGRIGWQQVFAYPYLILARLSTRQLNLFGKKIPVFGVVSVVALVLIILNQLVESISLTEIFSLMIVAVADGLRRVPGIGAALSFMFCPLMELGRSVVFGHENYLSLGVVAGYLGLATGIQLPELMRIFREDVPRWRHAEEISNFGYLSQSGNYSTIPMDSDTAEDLDAGIPPAIYEPDSPAKPAKPSGYLVKSGSSAKGKVVPWILLATILAWPAHSGGGLAERIFALIMLGMLLWHVAGPLLIMSNYINALTWWPVRRKDTFWPAAVVTLPQILLTLAGGVVLYVLDPEQLLFIGIFIAVLPAARFALATLMLLNVHYTLGRKAAALWHLATSAAALVGLITVAIRFAMSRDGYAFAGEELVPGAVLCILAPTVSGLVALWYEGNRVGEQLYAPLSS